MKISKKEVRGIRGATTVSDDQPEIIYRETTILLEEMIGRNEVTTNDIAAVLFSVTPDLKSAFPARAAREIGWLQVPLFCHVEIDVSEALQRCIRILILVNTDLEQHEVKHVYLNQTTGLRDL